MVGKINPNHVLPSAVQAVQLGSYLSFGQTLFLGNCLNVDERTQTCPRGAAADQLTERHAIV